MNKTPVQMFQYTDFQKKFWGALKTLTLIIPLYLLYVLSLAPLYAQDIRFERISVEQGLSQSAVHCIFQDSQGFMWFGTWDGLNKYDGYEFTVIKNDPENPDSLSHNSVKALYEDHEGIFWIGTEGGGLNRFNPKNKKFTRYQYSSDDAYSLSHDNIRTLYEDHEGMLWIGTEGGLNKFNPKKKRFVRFLHDPEDPDSLSHNDVRTIYEDQDGIFWIGTAGGGLDKFDPTRGKFVHFKHDPNDSSTISHNHVQTICKDHKGVFWVGTQDGLNTFDRKTGKFKHFKHDPDVPGTISHNSIWTICKTVDNTIWIGTEGGGLNKFDREKGAFIRYQHDPRDPLSLSHNVIWSVCEDRSGILWIGTYTGGLNKFDRWREQFIHYKKDPDNPDSLSHNVVWAFHEDRDGMVWIGTENGLNRFDRKKKQFTRYKHDPDNPDSLSHDEVWAICEDHAGMIWLGTYGGLNRFDRKTGKFTYYPNNLNNTDNTDDNKIRAIYEDSRERLWIGTAGGLNWFDRKKKQFVPYHHNSEAPLSLCHDNVWCVYEDHFGILWVGTETGLNRLDVEKKQFTHYQHQPENPQTLSDSWVLSIYEDTSGMLWVGTLAGLNKCTDRDKGIFTRYREKNGLPNDVIYGILEDSRRNLWVSTNKGLSKFNPRRETFKNYDVSDGVQSNEFNVGAHYKNQKGEMFFGGINGFNIFYPAKQNNPYMPAIVITDFHIFNDMIPMNMDSRLQRPAEYTKKINLSYKDRGISFEFVALHFASPEKNQYAYMMEEFDDTWIYSGTRRFAAYTNLAPGKYVFRVKGSNNDGIWNEAGTAIRLTITPPPWKTWWAYLIYMIMFIISLVGYIRHKTKAQAEELARHRRELAQKRAAAELLEKKVEERTRELNNALESVKEANKKVMDSLQYAKMIQRSLLPNMDQIKTYLPHSFIIWMPRDLVGGDIFFTDSFSDASGMAGMLVAVIDCTGHGVPGAFMTMIASSAMRRIIKDERCYDPAQILKRLNFIVKTTLQQDTEYALSDDGMDAAICALHFPLHDGPSLIENPADIRQAKLIYAGARLPLLYVLDGEITMLKGDRTSIGYRRADLDFEFENQVIAIQKGMCFYLASDGFQDQIGFDSEGNRKRFGRKRFMNLLAENSSLSFDEQYELLIRTFEENRGEHARQDDVTIMGFGFR